MCVYFVQLKSVFVSEYVNKSKTFFDYVEDIKVSRFHLTNINPVPVQNLHCVIYTWIKTQITLTLFRLAIKRVKLFFSNSIFFLKKNCGV